MANKFKKGDEVIVVTGSSKGKIGKINSILSEKALVGGVNIATVHKKPNAQNPGQIIKVEKPIHLSNISHVENGKPIKIKFITESGEGKSFTKKIRISKKSGKKIG